MDLARFDGKSKSFLVHVSNHKHLTIVGVNGNRRDEALGLLEIGGKLRLQSGASGQMGVGPYRDSRQVSTGRGAKA